MIWYEGVLKIYWGLKKSIQLAPGVLYAKAKNNRDSIHELVAPENCDLGNRERQLQVSNGWKSNSTVTGTLVAIDFLYCSWITFIQLVTLDPVYICYINFVVYNECFFLNLKKEWNFSQMKLTQ